MVFAFLRERGPDAHGLLVGEEVPGRTVYELDPCDPHTNPGTLKVRARLRAEGGWDLLGQATAPDGRRYQIWHRVERDDDRSDPDRPAA
jgi:hypothetical protein